MDSVLADWFSAGRGPLSARHPAFLCHVVRASTCTSRGFNKRSPDHFHPDPYTQSRTAERTLNSAIVHAEISRRYEAHLEIFDEFYADDIEGSSETMEEPIRGKVRVRSLLFSFLVPLHAMAEVGGGSISIRETPIPGDAIDETHSAWTLGLVGVSGKICTVSWRILRKWNESRVVLAGATQSRRKGRALGRRDRLRRVQHNRRAEPIGRESGFHVHCVSRPEGIRPVILLSLSQPTGFRVPLEILRRPDAIGQNTSRRDATGPSLLSSHRGDGGGHEEKVGM